MFSRYSQISNFPINVILMQPTTNHETFPDGSDQVDFEAKSKHRQFPIHVKEKVFYVDSYLFSKNSDYFQAMMESKCFLEGALGKIEINDESSEDILTLIKVLSPNYLGLYPDEVDEKNVCTVLRLCDKYLIQNLKRCCVDFLEDFDPSTRSLESVLHLFHHLCFVFRVEYEHDITLAETVNKTMYSCLTELLKPSNFTEFYQLRTNMTESDELKRVFDAVIQGTALFEHRLVFNEEVQGLGCHQCSKRPPIRQSRFNHGKSFVLKLCKSCGKEVCVQCRRKPCLRLFEEWVNEMRS